MSSYRTADGKPAAYVHEYVVTASELSTTPVGTILVDKGQETHRTWHFFDQAVRAPKTITGKRRRRVCSTCAAEHQRFTPYGHDGPCAPDTPILEHLDASDEATP